MKDAAADTLKVSRYKGELLIKPSKHRHQFLILFVLPSPAAKPQIDRERWGSPLVSVFRTDLVSGIIVESLDPNPSHHLGLRL